MTEKDARLTDKLENLARDTAASAKRKIDAHVEAQTERLEKHVSGAKSRFDDLPGVKKDSGEED
ncbi:hypothetical protein [Microbacterium marinilacus]|uniref:Uncharacterized protein n=1 Tax=Microbacterium marinilacus TaxID=415209 RepID=A0ABP7B7M4_9MICO|nr:hypothetical protein [Microbacterium marinilacus]MBY0689935.1 hypothetical protein [Microbacterium marinilacus]